MRIYYFCLFTVFSSLSICAQDFPRNFESEHFVQTVFANMNEAGIDISQNIEWVFEFSHSDSLELATLIEFHAQSNQHIKMGTIKMGTIADNTARIQLEGLYLVEILDINQFSEQSLLKKIQSYQKMFEKASIQLVGVGYVMPEDSLNRSPSTHEPLNVSPSGQMLKLIDKLTRKPIAYASIGIAGKEIGTVSNIDGKFSLTIPQTHILDTITISCIGYEAIQIPVKIFQRTGEFHLTSKARMLNEVAIQAKSKAKAITLGIKNVSGNSLGFIQGKGAGAGAEAARLMKYNRKVPLYLNEVSIYVENTTEQSIQLLVNIYTQDSITGLPQRNLMQEPLLVTSEMNKGWLTVNLNKQQIIISQPFFVAFQWIDTNTKSPYIALKGNLGYQRSVTMGSWIKSSTFSWAIKAKGIVLK